MQYPFIAQEMLGYSFTNNNLGSDIEKIYKDLLNYKNELQIKYDITKSESATKYNIALLEYFNKVTLESLTKLLKKRCNIHITKSVVNKQGSPFDLTVHGMIAILPDYDKSVFSLLSKLQKSGYLKINPTDDFDKIISKLQKDYSAYDPKTGKLSVPVEATLMLEPNLILFPEKTNANIDSFTAKELTAITLHEIGHVYETTASVLHLTNNAYNLNHLFMQFYNMSPADIHKFIRRNQTILEQSVEDSSNRTLISAKDRTKVLNQISSIIESISTSNTFEAILQQTFLTIIYGKISAILIVVKTALQFLKLNTIYYLYNVLMKNIAITESHQTPHMTIEPLTQRSSDMSEINADLFVVLHGYQDGLISGLNKVTKMLAIVSENDVGPVVTPYRLPYVTFFLCQIFNIWYYLSKMLPVYIFHIGASRDTYRLLCERYENVLHNSYAALKKQNIPPVELKKIIKTIEQTKRNIDNSIEYFSAKYIQNFWDIVLGIKPLLFVFRLLNDANFTSEINKLLTTLDKLINNSLYYHSAKLKSLQRR